MSENKNGFENYHPDLFPRLSKLAHFLTDQCHYRGLSDYPKHPLDDALDAPAYTQESLLTADVAGWGVAPDLEGKDL